MFSGIVEETGSVKSICLNEEKRLIILSSLDHSDTNVGDSIAINGVCLTVVAIDNGALSFDLAEETLRCTTLGALQVGSPVNIERSLKMGDKLSGHFVFGHVDTTIELISKVKGESDTSMTWKVPSKFLPYIASKGSVSISGISLTVASVSNESFTVCIIPHTMKVTNLDSFNPGDLANFEVDMLSRYVVAALENRATAL